MQSTPTQSKPTQSTPTRRRPDPVPILIILVGLVVVYGLIWLATGQGLVISPVLVP